jgi:hypothetical protein
MARGNKRWLAIGLLAIAAGGGSLLLRSKVPPGPPRPSTTEPAFGGFRAGGLPAAAPETPEAVAQSVDNAMVAWRGAILNRDAETVMAVDRAFMDAPPRYTEALTKSAESDSDPRVRAFSTRMLGKFKQTSHAELFERLLGDKSPYVRQNAAWALGELAGETNGLMVTRHALAELRHVQAKDPAGAVRTEAATALSKLE